MSRWICIDDICIPSDENDWEELVTFADAIAEQEPVDIVCCRECKHWSQAPKTDKGWCDRLDGLLDPEWYCADGERKSDE